MNITRGNRKHAEAAPMDGVGSGTLGRRSVLGGLAAVPVLYSLVGSAAPASAAAAARRGNVPVAGSGDLVQGVQRQYNAPLLAAGTRLVLPAGVKAVPVQDYYTQPRLAAASAWPYLKAGDGTTVDASVIPYRGAPTRVAVLSGFTDGWYEVRHANGRADRVTWDAGAMPFLWLYGEFGAKGGWPYDNRFYTLTLQPMSANPYATSTSIR